MGCHSGKERAEQRDMQASGTTTDAFVHTVSTPSHPPSTPSDEISDAEFDTADDWSLCSDWDEEWAEGCDAEDADINQVPHQPDPEVIAHKIKETHALYGFNASFASPEEQTSIGALRRELQEDLDSAPQHPELISDWKLLRFLRGHGEVQAAAAAFRRMLAYRVERDVDAAREELLEGVVGSNGRLKVQLFQQTKWPYLLPKFSDLRSRGWDSVVPCVQHGYDSVGNLLTYTYFRNYNINRIAEEGLGDEWLHMALHCDVYFDLLLHELSNQTGRMIARHDVVDSANVGVTTMGPKGLALLGKLGASAEQYPEMILRTSAVNFGRVALAVMGILKPFLPKQTASKFTAFGSEYELEGISESRPHNFGGSCCCNLCKSMANHWITFNVQNGAIGYKNVHVPASSRVVIEVEPGSGVVVGCLVTRPSEADKVIHRPTKVEKNADGERRLDLVFKPGNNEMVKLSFDNTSAGFFSADVKYRVRWSALI